MKRKELLQFPVQMLTPHMEELLQRGQDRKPIVAQLSRQKSKIFIMN